MENLVLIWPFHNNDDDDLGRSGETVLPEGNSTWEDEVESRKAISAA
jgi:hypothetical protein